MAKQQRFENERNARRKRKVRIFQSIVAFLVIAGLIGFGVYSAGKSARDKKKNDQLKADKLVASINKAAKAAGCDDLKTFPDLGHSHIEPPATAKYNSNPPTSGSHYSQQLPGGPGYTGVNPAPLPNEVQVHNLEHGHIGIQYNATKLPADVKQMLEQLTKTDPQWVFMAPRDPSALPAPGFTATLAFSAWSKNPDGGRLVTCGAGMKDDPKLVKTLAATFHDAYKDKAPTESIPGTPFPGS